MLLRLDLKLCTPFTEHRRKLPALCKSGGRGTAWDQRKMTHREPASALRGESSTAIDTTSIYHSVYCLLLRVPVTRATCGDWWTAGGPLELSRTPLQGLAATAEHEAYTGQAHTKP